MQHPGSIILSALGCTLNFSRLVSDCHERSGLSPQDFASKLGISKQKLGNIESGKARTLPKEAAEYARILNESEEQFVRLALQDMFDKDGLNYNVVLHAKKI